MRGISFEIPNKYGKYLLEILDSINLREFTWRIGDGESYFINNNQLGTPLFLNSSILDGDKLYENITKEDYYLLFVDLKGFTKKADVREVATFEEYMESECQIVVLIIDSSYVTIYAKNQDTLRNIFAKAVAAGYEKIEYITHENDTRTRLIAF